MAEGTSVTAHFNGFIYKFKATLCRIYISMRAETDSYFHYANLLINFMSEPMIMYSNAYQVYFNKQRRKTVTCEKLEEVKFEKM